MDESRVWEVPVVKQEPVEFTYVSSRNDIGSLDAASSVKMEPVDADDGYSLEDETVVKGDIDIKPTVIHAPDIKYEPSLYQPESNEETNSEKRKQAQFVLEKNISTHNSSSDDHKEENPTSNLKKKTRAEIQKAYRQRLKEKNVHEEENNHSEEIPTPNLKKKTRAEYQKAYRQRLQEKKKSTQTKKSDKQKIREAANSKAYRERKKQLRKEGVLMQTYSTQESSVLQSQRVNARTQAPNENEQTEPRTNMDEPVSRTEQERDQDAKNDLEEENDHNEEIRTPNLKKKTRAEYQKAYRQRLQVKQNSTQTKKSDKQKIREAANSKAYRERKKKLRKEGVLMQNYSTQQSSVLQSQRANARTRAPNENEQIEPRSNMDNAVSRTEQERVQHLSEKRDDCRSLPSNSACSDQASASTASVHDNVNLRYHCDVCEKSFQFQSKLNWHMTIHTDERPYCCDICDKRFRHRYNFNAHVASHTRERTHACEVCKKLFIRKGDVVIHMQIHTSERLHSCSVCGKSFTLINYLRQHEKIHKRPRCNICQKSFSQKSHLHIHMLKHLEKRDNICTICGKTFIRKYDLKMHTKIHMGDSREREHSCNICQKSYFKKSHLKGHMLTHSDKM